APSLREHICITLDRLSVNKYWGTGSERIKQKIAAPLRYGAAIFCREKRGNAFSINVVPLVRAVNSTFSHCLKISIFPSRPALVVLY
ncbi:MAG: hypothetical protein K2M19_02440, partial [Muribaculaceae bacterium]|nr:hypothetical protein [Muribaculaceae bacterium]